eukprot:151128-Amphidinium_carterae.1
MEGVGRAHTPSPLQSATTRKKQPLQEVSSTHFPCQSSYAPLLAIESSVLSGDRGHTYTCERMIHSCVITVTSGNFTSLAPSALVRSACLSNGAMEASAA